jgi:hypothetical protein
VLSDVAAGHALLADGLLSIGDRVQAKASLRVAIEVYAGLSRAHPENPYWEQERASLAKQLARM